MKTWLSGLALALLLAGGQQNAGGQTLRFALLGDRTGEAQSGVYEAVWQAVRRETPQFALNAGDTIQGGDDATAAQEWRQVQTIWTAAHRFPFYLVAGNHDVWSPKSEALFEAAAHRPVHYSFTYRQAHFTVLDNSRTEDLGAEELEYLRRDLAEYRASPLKFIVFHRPSWLLKVLLRDPDFPLHRIAKEYGVQYVLCGHLHQMLHFELDGVQYVSLVSSGGHLRGNKKYDGGWFFGYALVEAQDAHVTVKVQELPAPFGQGRRTDLAQWGAAGLAK